MNTSIKLNTPCELINVTPLNPLISKCQIKVCYVGEEPNHNKSVITKEVAVEMANSLPGSPIVGYFNEGNKDFEEHNRTIEIKEGRLKFKDNTRPYGFVDLGAQVWFQDYLDGNDVHTYLCTEGYIWTGQYPEAKRIIEKGNNQSMELDRESMKGSWTYDDNSGMEFFIINDAIFSKLCILGDDFQPCFEGANITKFSLDDDFNHQLYTLMKEVRKLKGENITVDDLKDKNELNPEFAAEDQKPEEAPAETTPENESTEPEAAPEVEEETPAAEEEQPEAEEEAPAAEDDSENEGEEEQKEDAEEPVDEDNNIQFSLTDFQNLQENYSNLEVKFNELQTAYNTMKESYDSLVEFKNSKDREEKQAMIDSFYMLGDEDKKDCQDNIDTYSLDEIEAKLSIICVHNKLDLSGNTDSEDNSNTTFSLDDVDDDSEDTNIPALVSALRKTKKSEN